MAETKVIDTNRRVFANMKAMLFTPWVSDSELGEVTYDLVNIVGDTTSLEQAENEVNALEHEFSNEPLYENINLGEKTFTTECIDFQNDALKNMFDWTTDENGNAFAPIVYKDLFCKIELHFNSTDDIVVLPKVKMNSRAVLATMKTDASRGNISGTCYSAWVSVGDLKAETDMAVIAKESIGTYVVSAEEPVGA